MKDIEGVSALTYFEVINMGDNINPYPMLLRVDWAININGIINFKKWTMSFRRKVLLVVVPLDPIEGPCYTKPVCDYEESDDDLDHIYKITVREQD